MRIDKLKGVYAWILG